MAFPCELYHLIIQNVDTTSDLYALLFVSGVISYEAERVLYHTIHIPTVQSWTIKLFLHLSRCARVARHTRELSIHDSWLKLAWTTEESGFQNPWQFFNKTLSALTNLRVLKLAISAEQPPSRYEHIPSIIFSGCTFKLRVLNLTGYVGEDFSNIDLTQVKELSLTDFHCNRIGLKSDPVVFPSLQVLTTSTSQLRLFGASNIQGVKALKILNILLYGGLIEETFVNVTSLAATEDMLRPFPSVRYFTMFEVLSTVTDDTRLTTLLRKCASLKSLEKLCFSISERIDQFPADLDIHIKVFSEIDTLQEFVLIAGVQEFGRLWKRNGEEAIDVSGLAAYNEWKDSRWL